MPELPEVLNILVVTRANDAVVDRIKAIAPERLNVILETPSELPELQFQMPGGSTRPPRDATEPKRSETERRALIHGTHIVFGGVPFPRVMPNINSNLIWAHFGFAGTSNLMGTEWWGTDFITTSSRGYVAPLPIAQATIAGMFAMAKKLDVAAIKGLEHDYSSSNYGGIRLIGGKTMGIVGLGGIGREVARLAKGLGMRVVATRRSTETRQSNVEGVDELYPAADLHAMLAESDFVAVCTMWTEETERMMNAAAFDAMKPGSFLMNIARGEVIDNDALGAALTSGKLAGAYLDVWDEDFAKPPPQVLQDAPNVIFTPHVSNRSDVPQMFSVDVFCNNLQKLLNGEELENTVDWARGY